MSIKWYLCPCGAEFRAPVAKTLEKGRHLGHPDDDSPDDIIEVCPECGEQFDPIWEIDE